MQPNSAHDNDANELVDFRRQVEQRFPIPPVAFSADGRSVLLTGPLTLGLRIGGFAVVHADSGSNPVVIHVREIRVEERPGPEMHYDAESDDNLGVPGTTLTVRLRGVAGQAVVLGRLVDRRFEPSSSTEPFGEQFLRAATPEEIGLVLDTLDRSADTIEVGTLRDVPALPARLRSKGFSRHTFMCGQSGSGKTYTTGVLFERLIAGSTLPMLILDPNSDHVHLGELADPDDPTPQAQRYRAVADQVVTVRARGHEATHTLSVDFSDLDPDVQAKLLRLHPIADLDDFAELARITASLPTPYSIEDVARAASHDEKAAALANRIVNLRIDRWGLWRRDGEETIATIDAASRRCVVIDTGSLTTPEERTALALAVLGRRWRGRRNRRPTLLAIDEAHNVLPASTNDPLLQAATEIGTLIAGEGRKFGLHLFLASQRPSKVHPNVLSQCDNLILMRMNGIDDIDDLQAAFSHVPPMLISESLGFGLGQALVAGPLAPLPLLAQIGTRLTPEGGGDLPTTWTAAPT
mgnify:FL=1